jgi:DNA-binding MarR family transcriptional regulator
MAAPPRDHIDVIRAQWRRERSDLDTEPLVLMGRLIRVVSLADAALTRPLVEGGLQPGWFDLLAALRRAGPPYELNPTELMHAMLISSAGVTKRLDRLVGAGLVARRPDPDDRRGTLVRLTRKGKASIDRAVEAHVARQEAVVSVLTAGERRTLDSLLRKLLVGLEDGDA